MRNYWDSLLTALAIIFAVPVFLILASWNALPGDSLYGVKTSLEKIALAVTIKTPLASMLSLNFTDRRFNEANRLLVSKGSTLGYDLLVTQAIESQQIIVEKKDTKRAAELVANIENYQKNIEQKRQVLASQPSAVIPPSVSTPMPTAVPTASTAFVPTTPSAPPVSQPQAVATLTPTPTQPTTTAVIADLEHTNQQLEKIKEDIKKELPEKHEKKPDNEVQKDDKKDNKREDH